MTGDDLLLLNDLKGKVQQLFSLYENLEKEKEKLELENQSLREEIKALNLEKENLRKDFENRKLSEIIALTYDDRQEAKRKINSLLREIDRCIALLNR
jgi:hypothetical protein